MDPCKALRLECRAENLDVKKASAEVSLCVSNFEASCLPEKLGKNTASPRVWVNPSLMRLKPVSLMRKLYSRKAAVLSLVAFEVGSLWEFPNYLSFLCEYEETLLNNEFCSDTSSS